MSEQDLKKLKRSELLEMMVNQANGVAALRAENEQLKKQLEFYEKRSEEQDATITRLRSGLSDRDDEINGNSEKLDQFYKQIEVRLKKRSARIKELEAEVNRLHRERLASITQARTLREATDQLNLILEDARRATEEYLTLVNRKLGGR